MYIVGLRSDPTWLRIVNGTGAVLFLFIGLDIFGMWGGLIGAAAWIAIYLPVASAVERRRLASASRMRRRK